MKKTKSPSIINWSPIAKNWKQYRESLRPSSQDVKTYRKTLKKYLVNKHNPQIVILGSTPELRDIAAGFSYKQHATVMCVDVNPWCLHRGIGCRPSSTR